MQEHIKIEVISKKDNKLFTLQRLYVLQRRVWEMIGCLLLLFVLLPIILVTSLCILILDGKPIFFKQIRVGKHGQPFTIWKFRTMVMNQYNQNPYQNKPWHTGVPDNFVFKSGAQKNVTKLGSYLRKYSIDELPQLLNVLKGDMSFIGPRPEVPEIVHWYNHNQRKRLNILPGITGLAQVKGRSNMNHGKKINYDLHYINHIGFLIDIKILLLTIIKVFKTDGAY